MITENKFLINQADRREIPPSLIANVLLSMASLLEVTGWIGRRCYDDKPTQELDIPQALWQVVHRSFNGEGQGLWHATREALLKEIGNGCKSLSSWNDRQKSADVVIGLCRRTANRLQLQKQIY